MKKIAVFGYGTVGSGVVEIVERNAKVIEDRLGEAVEIKYVLDLKEFPGTSIEHKVVHNVDVIIEDPEVDVVVEVMGGVEPAFTFVSRALCAGKSAVTSNKALVAAKGEELLAMAKEHNVSFLFEASVGGGIPIIRPLNMALCADEFEEITGILNGTTNYILTRMADEGLEFGKVLQDAQDNGFAERDPSADIEGYDACRKIAILSSIAYGHSVNYEDIHTEGINGISAVDIAYARALKCKIKLLARSVSRDGKVYALVAPYLLSKKHPLYSIDGVINSVYVKGNMVGDLIFTGAGAGKLPTASAVVGDVIDALRNEGRTLPCNWKSGKLTLSDYTDIENAFFVRLRGNYAERKAEIDTLFADYEVIRLDDNDSEFAIVTSVMSEGKFEELSKKLNNIITALRVSK